MVDTRFCLPLFYFFGARLHQFEFITVIFVHRIIFESFSDFLRFNQRSSLNVFVGQLVIILWRQFLEQIVEMMYYIITFCTALFDQQRVFLINKGSVSFMRVKKIIKAISAFIIRILHAFVDRSFAVSNFLAHLCNMENE